MKRNELHLYYINVDGSQKRKVKRKKRVKEKKNIYSMISFIESSKLVKQCYLGIYTQVIKRQRKARD